MTTLETSSRAEWRRWLATNGDTAREVWLVLYGKDSGVPSLRQDEAVEEALCFGWVDSVSRRRDDGGRYQRFTPRRPRSDWSKVNRERAERLIDSGRMAAPGLEAIEHAKRTGTWSALADAQDLVVPDDLRRRLAADAVARRNFDAFPPSSRRQILVWIAQAKRPRTREIRIATTVELAARDVRANHPRTTGE